MSHRPFSALSPYPAGQGIHYLGSLIKASTAQIRSRISQAFSQVQHVEEIKHIHQDQDASFPNIDPATTALWIRDVDESDMNQLGHDYDKILGISDNLQQLPSKRDHRIIRCEQQPMMNTIQLPYRLHQGQYSHEHQRRHGSGTLKKKQKTRDWRINIKQPGILPSIAEHEEVLSEIQHPKQRTVSESTL